MSVDVERQRLRYRAKNHLRRLRTLETDITTDALSELYTTAITCPLCGVELHDGDRYDSAKKNLDHIVPLCIGGTHTLRNVRIICRACNLARPSDGSDVPEYAPFPGAPSLADLEAADLARLVERRDRTPRAQAHRVERQRIEQRLRSEVRTLRLFALRSRIVALYGEGRPPSGIALLTCLPISHVRHELERASLLRRPGPRGPWKVDVTRARQLAANGLTNVEIARLLTVSDVGRYVADVERPDRLRWCVACGQEYEPSAPNALYCSCRCQERAKRARRRSRGAASEISAQARCAEYPATFSRVSGT